MIHCESYYGENNQNMVYLMLVQGLKHEHTMLNILTNN